MKTVIIWDQHGQDAILFFVVNGDQSELDGIYINSEEDENEDKLKAVVFSDDLMSYRYVALTKFPVGAVKEGANVIVAGWMP